MDEFVEQRRLSRILNANADIYRVCAGIKKLRDSHEMTDEQIERFIHNLNLPLKHHLFILGNYSHLMELRYKGVSENE